MNFNTMNGSEIAEELHRFNLQLLQQREEGRTITPGQIRRWKALSIRYKQIWDEIAK